MINGMDLDMLSQLPNSELQGLLNDIDFKPSKINKQPSKFEEIKSKNMAVKIREKLAIIARCNTSG
jgi:hypothetical protein